MVNNEATKTDKAGSDKKQAATETLVNQTQTTTDATLPDTLGFVSDTDYQSKAALERD
ncbi:hypothetical protein [Lactobacillus xylocopicola]|uniref:Uncharacterized protein n=1 Tax=Lactobacillus xylocopicola TaxID=2976676 RepID=A0ABM8BIN4_9LACO|nr:hypothetical protein [Lactobacillus xylocopicola]BDR61157.1 hypothetical protein KIM322_14180 [Lactobacillus xylocopicola]